MGHGAAAENPPGESRARYRIANSPGVFLITIQAQGSGREPRKERIFSSVLNAPPLRTDGRMDGWMNSVVIESHPRFTNGQASPRPQNLSAERAYFHLARLAELLILLKTPVTRSYGGEEDEMFLSPRPSRSRALIHTDDRFSSR